MANLSETHVYLHTCVWRSIGPRHLELPTFKCLAELPSRWSNIVAGDGPAIAGGDLEGERLATEVGVALPVLVPVP